MNQASPRFPFPEGYPELLEQIGQTLGRELLEYGIALEKVRPLVFKLTEAVRADVGGSFVYISKGVGYDLSIRDKAIWEEFNGKNICQLARKYKLTEMQIHNVLKKARAADRAQRQATLPGLDN